MRRPKGLFRFDSLRLCPINLDCNICSMLMGFFVRIHVHCKLNDLAFLKVVMSVKKVSCFKISFTISDTSQANWTLNIALLVEMRASSANNNRQSQHNENKTPALILSERVARTMPSGCKLSTSSSFSVTASPSFSSNLLWSSNRMRD